MSTDNLVHSTRTAAELPLTAAQRGIYYAQQIDPDVPMSVAAFVEFHGDVDADRLETAVTGAALETEAGLLRLVWNEEDEPTVVVDGDRDVTLGRRDFSGYSDPRAAAENWMDEHRAHVPDLFTDPLLQTYLLTLGPDHSIWYCWGHHLAFDGYAAMYMMLRVAQRYTAADGSALPEATIASMAEVAGIDDDYRGSNRFSDDRDYWSNHLGQDVNALPSTSFSGRSDVAAPLATIVSESLDDAVVQRIRARATGLQVRPASVITAAVALYLARFNDTADAMLSLPVAARDTASLRTSAGLTSNVVPILARIDDAEHPCRVDDLIHSVNGDIKQAIRHQHFRHEDIVSEILGAANGRRGFFGPMVNVMLFFKHIDFGPLSGALHILSTGPVEDASVNVYDSISGGMHLDLEANPNVYDDADVHAHHRRLIDFLTRFVTADPALPVTALPVATTDEIAVADRCSVGPVVDYGHTTLADLLSTAYRSFGSTPALIDPDGPTLTYDEVGRRVAATAAGLRARGIGIEDVVGVMLPRGLDQHIVLHAVVATGAVFVPLSPDEPGARRERILEIAAPALVVVDDDQGPIPAQTATPQSLVTTGLTGSADLTAPPTTAHPDNGAYLLFTSGSTGAPKGVLITHRALVNRLSWMQSEYALTSDDRVLQKTPSSFDVSVWEYFWPLTVGAAAVVAAPDGHRDPWYLRRVVEETGVSAMHFVPSMLAVFAETLGSDSETTARTRSALASIHTLFTSGEALTPGVVDATAALTAAPIHNLYGPTEAAIDVTHRDACDAEEPIIPIGIPVHNTTAYVLDRRLDPMPTGAVGELYLGGVQLARGYLRRPALTADRFVADPFGGGRLYRTGDLVRRRRDGELEYLGRSDSQFKIRGRRVELGEIESALADLPGVLGAGAVVRDDLLAERIVVGYVSGDGLGGDGVGGDGVGDRDLRGELAATLEPHMIPTVVVVCDALPTTSNGKLDRRALPDPDLGGSVGHDAERDTPATDLEHFVHDTACAVLGIDDLPMTAGLIEVGGNSLAATRVAARLSTATGIRLGIRHILDATDIRGIADALRARGVADDAPVAGARSTHVSIDGPVPLSPAQQRLWLAARLDSASAGVYNIPFTVRLIGDLDVEALTAALNDVVARHEPLRTTVRDTDQVAYQEVWAADRPLLDVARTDADTPESVKNFASQPFDLTADLPIRARLIAHDRRDHTLAVVIHHLAADGWSLGPLADDLAEAYRARRLDQAPAWTELPVTYRQSAADRHAWLDDPTSDASAQIEYWARALADAPVDTELPYDRSPSRTDRRSGAHVRVPIDAATRGRLMSLANRYDTTPFMVVHAAVAALLRTMSSIDDVVVGTPVSGRGDDDLDPLIGMFVNTLALRTSVDKNAAFSDLLSIVRERDLEAFDNADVPFDRLVTELNPARSSSGQPYFDVSVALEDAAQIRLEMAGLAATAAKIDIGTSKFDLEFTIIDRADDSRGMDLDLGYADELFDRVTAAGLASRYVRLLQTVTAEPDISIGDACVLDLADRLDLVPAVGGGTRPVEHFTQLLGSAAAAEPFRPAIIDGTGRPRLTYRELDEASNALARTLIDKGAGPESYVAVALPRGVDWMVAVWAVAKSGAAWVPVDPSYPVVRTEFMLDDSGATVIVTDSESATRLSITTAHTVVLVDADDVRTPRPGDDIAAVTDVDRIAPVDVDQPAYLIYTSGTTGRPKGVVVSHRGLADFAAEQVSSLALTGDSRTLHLASPSFDASILEVIMAVSAGASMCIAPADILGGSELSALMADAAITHAFLTPSLLTTMSPDDLPRLRTLVIGGEHPNTESVRRWSAGRRLINAYGPTEATVVATMSQSLEPTDSVTIGRPIRGVSALVLDERLRPVAPGVVGELYLSGSHLARGYHGARPLTSKRFVANPYGESGDRMYRTGDLVRWTASHVLEFRGRADHQAKVRGHRIELGEVDAALLADDAVQNVVTIVSGSHDTARLVAYATAPRGGVLDDAALRGVRDRLTDRLPGHMVPATIIALDEIPVTHAGKIDTRSLPAPETTWDRHVRTPLRGDAEHVVADEIARVLDVSADRLGRESDFFELGGNSLSATQLATALENRTDTRVPVRALFDNPDIAAIARLIGDTAGTALVRDERPRIPLVHDSSEVPAEPGPAQQQLWFLNQLAGPDEGAAYNIAFALHLDGDLDVPALEGAIRHAVARHEPLRTRYPARDGHPMLDVLENFDVTLRAHLATDDEWDEHAREIAARPFDLTTEGPLRVALHRLPAEDGRPARHRLTLVIHHIAADGASMTPLARDIGSAYSDLHAGRDPQQPALPFSYSDYLRWQAAGLASENASRSATRQQELTSWWRENLAGMGHAPVLASDRSGATGSAGVVETAFDDDLRAALQTHSVPGVTDFMTVHAVLATLLHRMSADPATHVETGVSDLVIGTPVAGRPDPGLADLVGMFVNSVPLRTRVSSNAPFTELLAAVRDADLDAIAHADMPFEKLVAAIAPPRTGRHPLFDVAVTLDDAVDSAAVQLADVRASAHEIGTGGARFGLELRIRNGVARFTYDVGLYSEQRIADLAERFTALARQIADDPARRIGDFELTRPTDGPADPYLGATEPVHLADLVDRAVRARPNAVALDDGVWKLTYRDAGRLSDRWARTLTACGVGPDDIVAVSIARSTESVLATWSIAKTGAAVMPVDPRYPADRIRHMLADSGASIGVTTSSPDDDRLRSSGSADLRWITVDELTADLPGAHGLLRDRPVRRVDGCAYIVYTSGTTGIPKGTSITHRGLAAFAATQTRRYGVDAQSRTLHFASPGFDAAMLELLLALDACATMVIAPTSIYGGDELTEFLAEERVTHAFVTPAAMSSAGPRDLPDLRCLGVGGESFGSELVARWGADRTFLNCYGPTEATIVATISSLRTDAPITIGRPVDGVHAVILDSRLRPVPPFAPGDLYLMGPGLARGYVNRAAQTSTAFVSAIDGSGRRMYRTGDLASTDLAGTITFHGRNDRQVKVRGFRIELDEIDSALAAHPEVDAAITQVHGSGDAARLVSYVTGLGEDSATSEEVVAFAAQRLPRQMLPSIIVPIDEIPMTVNGKVDRDALPAPEAAAQTSSRRPAGAAERVLAELVADTLGLAVGSVGADDDFFTLGGTSLAATTLVSRINAVHRGAPIRVRSVFDDPVIARLARLLDVDPDLTLGIDPEGAHGDVSPIVSGVRPMRFPLAPMQRRIWSLHRSDPNALDYAMPFMLRLHGSLDTGALRDALVDVVTRHAVLRTVYTDTADGPVGIVSDDAEQVVGDIHTGGIDTGATDPESMLAELLARPFDLTRDAPLRALLTGDGDSHALVLVLHHIAADGGSMPTIVGDLLEAYRDRTGASSHRAPQPPAIPDYRDYAHASDAARESDDLEYWTSTLTGTPAVTSVDADPARADQTGGSTVELPIDDALRDEIAAFARSNSTSAFTVLHTALAVLLNRLGAGDDLVIGTPVDTRAAWSPGTRTGLELRGMVGMFVNTVALRTRIDRTACAQSLVEEVRAQDLDAWDHLTAPFDDVVSALNPARVSGRSPLFQVALSVHDFAGSIAGEQLPVSADLVGEIAELDTHTAKFDLQFTVTGMDSQSREPRLALTYARNRYGHADAEQLGVRLLRVARALVTDPQRCIGDIRITDPLEVARLAPVSGPPATRPRTYAELLDDAVRRNPGGVAVTVGDPARTTIDVTYLDMYERANRLARHLLNRGVARDEESVVAVAIPRSLEAIVAIWAIVRTGAAYVPIDPMYPADRIAHMLDDAGADLVITTSDYASPLPARGTPTIVLDEPGVRRELASTSPAPISDDELPRPIDLDQLAYVIYTSGSTGTPKGVLVSHRGLAAVHDELASRMSPDTTSRVLHFASPSFDASVLEFLLAAAGAGTLVVVPTNVYGGADLQGLISRRQVTHAFITPAAVATMSPENTSSLTSLAVGGEAVSTDLVRMWAPGRTLLNVYGPTETTIITTASDPLTSDDRVTIGRPNNGVSVAVLDDRLHPVPEGVPGELYLLGPQITRGYHGRPGLTSTRYPAAPMVLGPEFAGQRMYRTGDLVRWTADGRRGYVGRTDDQGQSRGFRVELGVIDDALSAVPGVRAAVTVADPTSGQTVLHAYVTPDGDAASIDPSSLDPAAVRRGIARRLPRHMVPSTITVLDRLPLTAVGKVDRRELPNPTVSTTADGDAPVGAAEQRIADAFAEVLGADAVGRGDNFFDLGGDSLRATTLVTSLREAGLDVAVPDVFAAPTPAELASTLADDGSEGPSSPALAPLLTLRRGDPEAGRAPLFAIHPAIGLAWSFTTLLPHVDDDRPVYGLQNPTLSGAPAAETIDELAADYVRRIREVAPHGPYRLLGWSLGGLIAQEVGVALQRAGEHVEQLTLLDSYVLADHPGLAGGESLRDLLGEFGIDTSDMVEDPDGSAVSSAVRAAGGPLAELSDADLQAVRATFESAASLACQWFPRVFDGDAVFITADRGGTGVEARADWVDVVTGSLADVHVDCTHARMLLPDNVAQYAHVVENSPSNPGCGIRRDTHRKEI
ncbi:amino acid adenylation domain-containing protein [Gordonia sp. (in: high G+C Gram-positive bacteria)]|uniref:non-ribosomal peptide synthetase n=1 Tax=Gordonia sp. (in: high G+C Gram-positive bacteria) TaxID=84139 RepID=UPI003F9C64E5